MSGQDAAYVFRVRDLALSLAKEEGLDDHHRLEIVDLAALLHDIVKLHPVLCILNLVDVASISAPILITGCLHPCLMQEITITPSGDLIEDTTIVETFLNKDRLEDSKREAVLSIIKEWAGRRRAEKRRKFMQDFVAEFYEEWSGRA